MRLLSNGEGRCKNHEHDLSQVDLGDIATTQPTKQKNKTKFGWCGIIIGKKNHTTPPPPHHRGFGQLFQLN